MKKYSFIRRIFFAFKQTEKPENWLLQKIKENPFQFLWSLSLTCGGFFLFFFFLQMGFMPDINFSEVSGILIASALIGGYLTVLFTVLPMVPVILVLSGKKLKIWTEDSLKKNKNRLNLPLIILDTASILFLAYIICSPNIDTIKLLPPYAGCLIILAISVGSLCFYFREKIFFFKKEILVECVFNFSLIFFLFLVFFILTGRFEISGNDRIDSIIVFILLMYLQRLIANTIINTSDAITSSDVANSSNKPNACFYVIIAAILSIVIFLFTGAFPKFSKIAVYHLGLGERQVSVLLKKEGCDIFNAISKSTGEGEICKDNSVDSIYLKSRIASPYVFEKHKEIKKEEDSKKKEENKVLWRITIPKEYVVSLILQKQNSGQSIGSQSSDSSAQNNQLPDSSSPNKTPAQTSPEKCLTTCCMCCVPAASCHIPPNCPSKAKQESESRAQPC